MIIHEYDSSYLHRKTAKLNLQSRLPAQKAYQMFASTLKLLLLLFGPYFLRSFRCPPSDRTQETQGADDSRNVGARAVPMATYIMQRPREGWWIMAEPPISVPQRLSLNPPRTDAMCSYMWPPAAIHVEPTPTHSQTFLCSVTYPLMSGRLSSSFIPRAHTKP